MPNALEQTSNYTLTKLIRTGVSPLMAMIGTSVYYGQLLKNPVLGSINALLFSKKLGIDIWNINQRLSKRNKIINSYKKIVLGLGTISLINYAKFVHYVDNSVSLLKDKPCFWPPCPTYPPFISTTIKPIIDVLFVDWDTYISLNAYGLSNVIGGISELIPNKFESIRKICNMTTGGFLISTGVAMGVNNNFNNYFAIPTIVAGASEIINILLLPIGNSNYVEEMQEIFTDERVRLINDYDSLSDDVIFDRASLNWDYDYTLGGV